MRDVVNIDNYLRAKTPYLFRFEAIFDLLRFNNLAFQVKTPCSKRPIKSRIFCISCIESISAIGARLPRPRTGDASHFSAVTLIPLISICMFRVSYCVASASSACSLQIITIL